MLVAQKKKNISLRKRDLGGTGKKKIISPKRQMEDIQEEVNLRLVEVPKEVNQCTQETLNLVEQEKKIISLISQ